MLQQRTSHARPARGTWLWRAFLAATLVLVTIPAALLGGPVGRAHAAPLSVTHCDALSGAGSLADAVTQANADLPGDLITFNCSGTITLTSPLSLTQSMTIDGSGRSVTISGGGTVGLLAISPGISVTLTSLTLTQGNVFDGGAIDNSGTLTLNNSTISGNAAGFGGGIFTAGGALTVNNSMISGNSASDAGGAICLYGGTLTINSSTISANTATLEGGGGICSAPGSTTTVSNSTISGNTSPGGQGGGINNGGMLTMSNSTITANTADFGGGIFNNSGTLALGNDTVSGNTAATAGGGIFNGGTATLIATIVANQLGGGDCALPITSGGYNLDSDGSCSLNATGDLSSRNPLLGALANNGGPTQTMALLPGSPAINALPTSSGDCPATDQRGNPAGTPFCDIGAFQTQTPAPAPRPAPIIQTPILVWPSPLAIVYGTALNGNELNAVAEVGGQPVAGTISYLPPAGTILHAGVGQQLAASFIPLGGSVVTATGLVTITVTPAPTTLALTAVPGPDGSGAVTLTAQVSTSVAGAGSPIGTVSLLAGGTLLAPPVTLANGQVSLFTTSLAGMQAALTAIYTPGPNGQNGTDFAASQGSLALSIGQAATITTVASLHPTGTIGQSQLFTTWVQGDPAVPPTGTVSFYDLSGTAPGLLGTVPLDGGGRASLSEAGLAVGTHAVVARYNGTGRYLSSQSAPVSQIIRSCTVTAQLGLAGVSVLRLVAGGTGVGKTDLLVRIGTANLDLAKPAVTYCANPGRVDAQAVVTGTITVGNRTFPAGHRLSLTLIGPSRAHPMAAVLMDLQSGRRLALTGPFDPGSRIRITTP